MTDFREYENGQHVNLSCTAPSTRHLDVAFNGVVAQNVAEHVGRWYAAGSFPFSRTRRSLWSAGCASARFRHLTSMHS